MNMSISKKINNVGLWFFIIFLLLLFLAPLAIFFGSIIWSGAAHGIPMSQLDQLHQGMSEDEVKTLVGEPKTIHISGDGGKEWSYSRQTWCIVTIRFSSDGKVVNIVHDH
jgi:hypothetical protein